VAEIFKRESQRLTTVDETLVYQAPNNTDADVAIVLGCLAANVVTTGPAEISLFIRNAANGLIARTALSIVVPAKGTLDMLPSKLVLKRGERIVAQANLVNRLDVTVSALEIIPDVG
jgi:hypothetical protein